MFHRTVIGTAGKRCKETGILCVFKIKINVRQQSSFCLLFKNLAVTKTNILVLIYTFHIVLPVPVNMGYVMLCQTSCVLSSH